MPHSMPMRNGWTEEAFNRFWHRMGEIFGKSWYEQNGPEANASWQASLVGIDLNAVGKAINHYQSSGDAFPPNLSTFMATSRQFRASRIDQPALTYNKEPSEHFDGYLKGIAKVLGKRDKVRSVFLHGESFVDYRNAKMQAWRSGTSFDEFERQRLLQNGWLAEDEQAFAEHARACGMRR